MELFIGKAGERDFFIDAQELVTGRTCIIAQSGAGKSWSIAVLCEQLCDAYIGFCLIDTEGEYFSLKDTFQAVWVGTDEQCDEDIEKVNLKELLVKSVTCDLPIIYDVSETNMQEKVTKLAGLLYDVATELRKPYLLIVEEADKFIPQSKDSIKKIEEISRRGRKRGLGLLVATQRPAIVTKNVLSQCNNQIIGKLSIENDLKAVDLFFSSRREVEELATLHPGEFFVMGGLSREKMKIRFKNRITKHRGLTPRLQPRARAVSEPLPASAEFPAVPPDIVPPPKAGSAPRPLPEAAPVHDEPAWPDEDIPGAMSALPGDAVAPLIGREDALDIALGKRRRKFLIFGNEERIADAELAFWPLVRFEARYISGILKKTTKSTIWCIDGQWGYCADLKGGLSLRPCFGELIGLDEPAVCILGHLTPSGATGADLEAVSKLPAAAVKKILRALEKRKLVTKAGKAGTADIYVPLLAHPIPRPGHGNPPEEIPLCPRGEEKARERLIDEEDVRRILKGIEPTAEITSFSTFYYPVYEIALASDRGSRTLYIDAVSGREILPVPETTG
ncbi:MAG: DUF87 domain-containing protein [Methanomicrobiales archaeon]|nr:DUF87 domain-containing protein [Methanomicrobiales archaeon]